MESTENIILVDSYKGDLVLEGTFQKEKSAMSLTRFFSLYNKRLFVLNLKEKYLSYGGEEKKKLKKIPLEKVKEVKTQNKNKAFGKWKYYLGIITDMRCFHLLTCDKETYNTFCRCFKFLYNKKTKAYLLQDKTIISDKGQIIEIPVREPNKSILFKREILRRDKALEINTKDSTDNNGNYTIRNKNDSNRMQRAHSTHEFLEVLSSLEAQPMFESPRSTMSAIEFENNEMRIERKKYLKQKGNSDFSASMEEEISEKIEVIDLTDDTHSPKRQLGLINEDHSFSDLPKKRKPITFRKELL